jgi:aspartate/methionine/tyrosine aminotransferase
MHTIKAFSLERYFARHEFSARYLLSCSDCEPVSMTELLAMADPESLDLWSNLKLAYTESAGLPLLREAIAGIYDGLTADDIRVMAPEEGIFLTMHALLSPGDHVVCTFPGYQSLYELARSIGCRVSMWEPAEEQAWHFDVRQLENLLEERTRLVVVNFPHNPTGALPDADEFAAMIDLVKHNGAYLLCDEMYRFLELDTPAPLPAACRQYDRAISLGGLSKSFGLPGLRIGWTATRDRDVLDRIGMLKDYTTICNNAPGEILALIALRSRQTLIAPHRVRIKQNILTLADFVKCHSDFLQWHPPQGGSICFPRMTPSVDTFAFCETLVARTGIMMVPSRLFDYGDHHVRFGLGREGFDQILDRLGNYLDQL